MLSTVESKDTNRISTGVKINEKQSVYVRTTVSKRQSDGKEYKRIEFGVFKGYEFKGDQLGSVFFEINATDEIRCSWHYERGWVIIKNFANKTIIKVRIPEKKRK